MKKAGSWAALLALSCLGIGGRSVAGQAVDGATVISSIEQADALVREAQKQFVFLFPPINDPDWIYVHPDQMRPVIWSSGWPNQLKKQMYAEMTSVNGNLYPVYKVWAEADPVSGDLTYYNRFGQAVWTSSAPAGYTPLAPVLEHYNIESTDELSDQQKLFSASSVGLEFQLMPEEFVSSYEQDVVLEEQQVATLSEEPMMAASTMSIPLPGDGTSTNSGGGGVSSDPLVPIDYGDALYLDQNIGALEEGWLDVCNALDGQAYEVYFTYNLQYVEISTNIPHYTGAWLIKEGLIASGGVAAWDAPLVGENGQYRSAGFMKAYESTDTDGDGLSDAYELVVFGNTNVCNPWLYDTDNDGISDGDEDKDGDSLTNYEEYRAMVCGVYTDPQKADSDHDGKPDRADPWPMDGAANIDTDGDRMPDEFYGEPDRISTSYPQLVEDPDDDNDLFSDAQEALMGTVSTDADSPGALVWLDSDGDGLFDWQDPYPDNPDGDNDGIGDGYEEQVLTNSATVADSYSSEDIDAYLAVAGDADGDGCPLWQEKRDSTNPADGLDFNVRIF